MAGVVCSHMGSAIQVLWYLQAASTCCSKLRHTYISSSFVKGVIEQITSKRLQKVEKITAT